MTQDKDRKNPSPPPARHPKINAEECKGCGRCVRACPRQCLQLGDDVNSRGYRFVVYNGGDCTGCAVCYYACPEPHAIRVHRGTETPRDPSDETPGDAS